MNPSDTQPSDAFLTPVAAAPHRALYRRWRAQTFAEIVGQEAVVTTLRNAVRTNRLAHGLLFVGPRGTGKTSLARIVAKAINCPNVRDGEPDDTCEACVAIREGRALDVIEMDAASNNKVDDMRELLERTWTAPSDLARKVYIVDEVQRIKEGWDVLLKTLEEPPDHVVFIFCTTDASQIRAAVLSRVQRFDFTRLSVEQIAGKLDRILAADGRTAEPGAVQLVARLAAGGMRDAESILDQVLSSGDDPLTEARVADLLGLVDAETVTDFLDALIRGRALAGLAAIDGLEERGRDLHVFLDQVIDAVRRALTGQLEGSATDWPLAGLVAVGRRLAAIDPSRASIGGLRFQLELALLDAAVPEASAAATPARLRPEPRPGGAPAVPPTRAAVKAPAPDQGPEPVAVPVRAESQAVASEPAVPAPATAAESAPAEPARSKPAASKPVVPQPAGTEPAEAPPAETKPAQPAREQATAPALAVAAATASDTTIVSPGLAELIAAWPRIVADLSSSPPIKPLVEACRPVEMTGNQVVLGFPEGKAFLRDVAERRRTHLEEGIGRVLGRAVAVRLVATNLDLLPAPAAEEVDLLTMARRVFADDLVDADEVH